MRILLTGSSGRVGRAIHAALCGAHDVVGLDRSPFSTTAVVAELDDESALERALEGAEAVIHTAALHAPHVGLRPDTEFERINVRATERLAERARAAGVRRFVFTSTTALYGDAVAPQGCTFLDEDTVALPRTVYHRSKLAAEARLQAAARPGFAVRVLRMSRCFPEPADRMAIYRLHRGIDLRDVAQAHVAALHDAGGDFLCAIVSGAPPFGRTDAARLAQDAAGLLRERCPALVAAFRQRGWDLPRRIDRVYDPRRAQDALGWRPRYGPAEVLAPLARGSMEVLPPGTRAAGLAAE